MKKTSFYSLMMKNGKKQAVLHNGYFDGTFYYFSDGRGWWNAIHPLVGLSVAIGNSRKETAERAHGLRVTEGLKNINADYMKKCTADFERCIQELKATEAQTP